MRRDGPWTAPYIVPVVSGLALIDGLPPADLPPFGGLKESGMYAFGYGIDDYSLRALRTEQLKNDSTISQKLSKRKIEKKHIYILNSQKPNQIEIKSSLAP
jgi:hypothetical protein